MSETIQFGVHLLFDGYNADTEKLNNKKHLEGILRDLPKAMKMHTIAPEVVVEVGELNQKDPGGLSGFVMIAESHISFHTFPNRGFVTADVYTCQNDLDEEKFVNYLAEAFGTNDFDAQLLPRGVRYPETDIKK